MSNREPEDALPPEERPESSPPAEADGDELEVLARLLREEDETRDPGEDYDDELVLLEEDEEEVFAGRFELVELLATGPHGELWRARDLEQQGRPVAIKRLEPLEDPEDEDERADLEADLAAWVAAARALPKDGENPLRDAGLDEQGRAWLLSDLVDGEDARELMDRVGAVPPRQAFEIARQVLVVLERAGTAQPHGHLVAENVLLLHRVPWSEDNPFGVGVRLTDHGLAPHLDPSHADDSAGDLRGVAVLLAELLTGLRVSPDGSDWAGSDGAASTAALSREARRLLDRSLDPRGGFESATAFRKAIEETPEWRPTERRSALPLLLVVFAVLAAAGFGLRGRIRDAFAAPPTVVDEEAAARAREAEEAARAERERRAALEAEKAALEGRLTELGAEVDRSRRTNEDLRSSEEDLAARAAEAEEERAKLDADLEATRRRLEEEAAARRAAEEERARTEAIAREAQAAAEEARRAQAMAPTRRTADAVRRYLAHLGAGDAAGATDLAGSLEDGHALATLAAAWRTLADVEGIGDAVAAMPLLPELEEARERAHTALAGLRAAGPAWLTLPAAEGDGAQASGAEVQTLLDGLDASLARLEARATALERELRGQLEERLAALSTGAMTEPSSVVPLASALGPERLRAVATEAVEVAERADGDAVDVEALAALEPLHAWTAFLSSDHRFDALFDRIQPFDLARALFVARCGPFPLPRADAAAPAAGTWREDVLLRGALLAPGTGLPGPVGLRLLYHARTVDGEESWRWDEVLADPEPPAGVDASRIVEQHFHDARGVERASRRIRVLRIGTRLFEEDALRTEVLDLSRPLVSGEVEAWHVPTTIAIPARLLVHPMALEAFRAELTARPPRALRLRRGASEALYAPTLGLLHRTDPAHITTELVFAELP